MSCFGPRPIVVLLLALVSPPLVGCLGGEKTDQETDEPLAPRAEGLPGEKRLSELGLVVGPPTNLIAACKRVAQETPLTVYCPPVVPKGPVEAPKKRHENAYVYGGPRTYGLSLQSDSLIDAGTHDPLAAQHWVVAAWASAEGQAETVDHAARYPREEFTANPKRFTVGGVKATLVTGDRAGTGFAGSGHAIVYWEFDDAFYQASVHFHEKAPIAEAIARGLIVQMVKCTPDRANVDPDICAWVFEGSQ